METNSFAGMTVDEPMYTLAKRTLPLNKIYYKNSLKLNLIIYRTDTCLDYDNQLVQFEDNH